MQRDAGLSSRLLDHMRMLLLRPDELTEDMRLEIADGIRMAVAALRRRQTAAISDRGRARDEIAEKLDCSVMTREEMARMIIPTQPQRRPSKK